MPHPEGVADLVRQDVDGAEPGQGCNWDSDKSGQLGLHHTCFIRVVVKVRIGTESLSKMSQKCIGIVTDPCKPNHKLQVKSL